MTTMTSRVGDLDERDRAVGASHVFGLCPHDRSRFFKLANLCVPGVMTILAWTAAPVRATEVRDLFPTDAFTVQDAEQLTGRRIALPLPPRCEAAPSECDELQLLNEVDGWSVTPRIRIRFSGPVNVDSLGRDALFLIPLSGDRVESELIALGRFVWDGDTSTLFARPERPLLQARRYAVIVTARGRDAAGRPLRPGRSVVPGDTKAAGQDLWRAVQAFGVRKRDIVAAGVFTTRSVTATLERVRALVDARPASVMTFHLEPGGGRSVYRRSEVESLEFNRQTAMGAVALPEVARPMLAAIPATQIGTIAFGRYPSVSFLSPSRHIPAWPTRVGAPKVTEEESVHITLFLPAGPQPPDGWPVVIFGHGFGGDRHLAPPLIAGTLARHGFAIAAINTVGHGGGPDGTIVVGRRGGAPVVLPAGGRGRDLDGDGKIGPTEGIAPLNTGPLATVSVRDGLTQTVADLMQLVRAIRGGVDVDGDGRPDLDAVRIAYVGQSFGGIYGTLLLATDPLVTMAVLNVAGGPVVEIARQGRIFRPAVIDALRRRRPPLMNGAEDFIESLPLWGEPSIARPAPGALSIQTYLDRIEWLGQPADPLAFAPYLRRSPLPSVGRKAVLLQMARGDLTVPNATTAAMARAGDLATALSIYRHDRAASFAARWQNPHGFLLWAPFADVASIGRAAQEQVAQFFLSGGRTIAAIDEEFDILSQEPRVILEPDR